MSVTTIKAVQAALGVTADGVWGARSQAALDAAIAAAKNPVPLSQTKSQFKLSQTSLDRLKGVNERLVMACTSCAGAIDCRVYGSRGCARTTSARLILVTG